MTQKSHARPNRPLNGGGAAGTQAPRRKAGPPGWLIQVPTRQTRPGAGMSSRGQRLAPGRSWGGGPSRGLGPRVLCRVETPEI